MSDALPDGSDTSDAMFRWRIGLGRFPGTRDEWRAAMRGIYGPAWDEMERVRRENAEARERWRKLVLFDLSQSHVRPCAVCGWESLWVVCATCAKIGWPLRLSDEARAKIRARRGPNVAPLPLP